MCKTASFPTFAEDCSGETQFTTRFAASAKEPDMFDLRQPTSPGPDVTSGASGLPAELFNSIPLGVFAVGRDLKVTAANDAALRLTGSSRRRVLGRSCCEVFRLGSCRDGCVLKSILATGETVENLRTRVQDCDGRRIPVSVTAGPAIDSAGHIVGGIVTLTNLGRAEARDNHSSDSGSLADIVTSDPNMRHLFEILPTIARNETSILVTGETGTGKNLIARTIHEMSDRAGGPFVTVNCAALPDTLLESELFGYKAGAFTGAVHDKPGRFAAAHGGTLFLDEIGDIPVAMQVKLLRVLQEKVFERLGDQKPIPCDIRIVAATHRDLEEMVDRGTFRRDLFYRINVLNLEIPPLRNRKGDIPSLAQKFVEGFSRSGRKHVTGVTSPALEILMKHSYPGNVRELENIIERNHVIRVRRTSAGGRRLHPAGSRAQRMAPRKGRPRTGYAPHDPATENQETGSDLSPDRWALH
jgi:PAS domain S-box-containing protein